eukprot:2804572-Pyramimonas_sp.AAC.1
MSANEAKGVDNISVNDTVRLPIGGRNRLVELLNDIENTCTWPRQLHATVGALCAKPRGGDRVLGLLPTTCKVWSQARSGPAMEWSNGLSAFWDTALRGSSALRAAMVRSLLDEVGFVNGKHFVTLLLDLEKFYDSVYMCKLINIAAKVGDPSIIVLLEVEMCIAPRFLKLKEW